MTRDGTPKDQPNIEISSHRRGVRDAVKAKDEPALEAFLLRQARRDQASVDVGKKALAKSSAKAAREQHVRPKSLIEIQVPPSEDPAKQVEVPPEKIAGRAPIKQEV